MINYLSNVILRHNYYSMRRKYIAKRHKILVLVVFVLIVFSLLGWYLSKHTIAILEPAGEVARKERNLMFVALGLSAIVVIPVYTLTIMIAWKYREGNKKAKYSPDWYHSRILEFTWWAIPLVIITILSIITWNSSHALDPYKPLSNQKNSMTVDVVALDWKWLFIYPQQKIASVNLLEFPKNEELNFNITSDTVMNSFWIPQLGGQIYAMPGMTTQLHLIADRTGDFSGWSSNISGEGFANMMFTARLVNPSDFSNWVSTVAQSSYPLNQASYANLAKPTNGYPVTTYALKTSDLFNSVVLKYMAPINNSSGSSPSNTTTMQGMY